MAGKLLGFAGRAGQAGAKKRMEPRSLHAVAAALALCAGAMLWMGATPTSAADGANAPVRPLAGVVATEGHDPFALVTADSAGEIRFALSEFADGATHFFTFMVVERPVEFFVIWTEDNVIRTAFNACDVCYRARLGYRRDGAFVVCNNCGNRFPIEKIATVSGGCNPAPLAAHTEGQDLVISADALTLGLTYFP